MAWPWRKQEEPVQDLHAYAANSAKLMHKIIDRSDLNHQKVAEKAEGLRKIVKKGDLSEGNLKIRRNAMSELLVGEIEAMRDELEALQKISDAIKGNRYEELLQQASTQKKYDENQFDRTQTLLLGNETAGSARHIAVGKAKQAGLEYKRLAKDLNTRVTSLKTVLGNSITTLIVSERAHVDGLIIKLKAHLSALDKIKTNLGSNPNLEGVEDAKRGINSIFGEYDIQEEAADLNLIRTENESIENNLNDFFKETGGIKELEKQIEAKISAINHILEYELDPNSNLLVL